MVFLDWSARPGVHLQLEEHPRWKQQVRISAAVSAPEWSELAQALRETFGEGGGPETRLQLPQGWTIYWKARDAESRLFMAHPEKEEWVVNASLEAPHGAAVIGALEGAEKGSVVTVSAVGRINRMSNVEIALERT
jgi:hypothetical protein